MYNTQVQTLVKLMQFIRYECKRNISKTVNLHHTGDPQLSNPCFKVTALLEHSSESVCSIRMLKHMGQVISTHTMFALNICTHAT